MYLKMSTQAFENRQNFKILPSSFTTSTFKKPNSLNHNHYNPGFNCGKTHLGVKMVLNEVLNF